jgi:shikimate kinase
MKVILVGYMASGKSVIGSLVAKSLNIPFFDLDSLIEESLKLSVSEIFKQKGELFFRKLERQILIDFLNSNDTFVLALGGGTPCYYDNFKLYEADSVFSFYLKGKVTTIYDRIVSEKESRPLVANFDDKEALQEFIAKHLFERSYFYHQVKTIVSIDDKNKLEIVSEILRNLT